MNYIRSLSITTQISLNVVILVSLSILVTSSIAIAFGLRVQIDMIKEIQTERSLAVASEINLYVDDLLSGLSFLARVQGLSEMDFDVQQSLLKGLSRRNSAYENLAIINHLGMVIANDSRGDMVITGQQSGLPAFDYAYSNQEEFIGSIAYNDDLNLPYVTMAVPIRNWANDVDGVLLATVNLRFLWTVISRISVGETGYVYVVDRSQFLIAQQGDTYDNYAARDISDLPFLQQLLYGHISMDTPYQGLRGVEVWGKTSFIPTPDWTVIVELPTAEIYAPIYQRIWITVIALVLAICVSLVASFLLSRQITRPLKRLTDVATQIGQGKLDVEIELNQTNELGILANTFNTMSGQLRLLIDSLLASETRNHAFLNAVPDLIFRNDRDGMFLDLHVNSANLLYVPENRIIGHKIDEILPVEVATQQEYFIKRALDTGAEQIFEYRLKIAEEWLDFEGRTVVSGDNEVLTIVRNITDRKQLEQEQLKVMMEKERIEILGNFINQASHEFKTPISTILTNLYLMKKNDDSSKNLDRIQKIEGYVGQVTKLINSLTFMSQLDSRVQQFIDADINLNDVIGAIRQDSQKLIDAKNVRMECHLVEIPIQFKGDFELIKIALENIVNNAIGATGEGGAITITSQQLDTEALIEICDTGTGITDQDLPYIFDRFYRADKVGTTRGIGLGLPIAKAIIDHYHGKIEVTTKVGVGSTFHVRIPMKNSERSSFTALDMSV